MSGTLLAPVAMLAALVAVGIVVAHLTRRVPTRRVAFGAMLLLGPSTEAPRRRRRVEDVLLLALRLAVLGMGVLAAAGPVWPRPDALPDFGRSGRVVVLVDRSLSMRQAEPSGETAFDRARKAARIAVGGLSERSEVAVITYDEEAVEQTAGFVAPASAAAAIDGLTPGLGRTDLRAGLAAARRLLDRRPGEVLLFSDESGRGVVARAEDELRRLAGDGAAVVPFPVAPEAPRNTWIEAALWSEASEGGLLTVRLGHVGPPDEVPCDVVLPDNQVISVFIPVDAEGGEKRVTVPPGAAGGVGQVRCEEPFLVEDNVAGWLLPRVAASRVLVVDGDPGETAVRSEVYFLERALAPFGGNRSDVGVEVVPPAGIVALESGRYRVAVLANVADVRPWGRLLSDFVHGGGMLVVSGGDQVQPDAWNAAIGPLLPAPMRRVVDLAGHGEIGVALAPPAALDPVLAPFGGSGAGFQRVRARAALSFDGDVVDGTRVPLRWEGGLPALIVRPVDRGAVVVWTSTFDLAWSDLALQAAFLPLVQGIVQSAGAAVGEGPASLPAVVGERHVVPIRDARRDVTVVDPLGRSRAPTFEGSSVVLHPDAPGRWAVDVVGGTSVAELAVRVDPSESDVTVTESVVEVEARLDPSVVGRRVDLGPWFWAGSGLVSSVAAGVAGAMAIGRNRRPQGGA